MIEMSTKEKNPFLQSLPCNSEKNGYVVKEVSAEHNGRNIGHSSILVICPTCPHNIPETTVRHDKYLTIILP